MKQIIPSYLINDKIEKISWRKIIEKFQFR